MAFFLCCVKNASMDLAKKPLKLLQELQDKVARYLVLFRLNMSSLAFSSGFFMMLFLISHLSKGWEFLSGEFFCGNYYENLLIMT